jgi:hypothetical protein
MRKPSGFGGRRAGAAVPTVPGGNRQIDSWPAVRLQLFHPRGVLPGNHSITMKTLLSLLSTLALITGIASLDTHQWNADVLFPALAVAALFALALADGPRPARFPVPGFELPRFPPLKLLA